MNNTIFRQKTIDTINSPENLNDYVKVTNPSIWIILVGVIVLIIGMSVYGILGRIDTNVNAAVEVNGGVITAYIDEADIDKIDDSLLVKINGTEYSIKNIADRPVKNESIDEFVLHKSNMEMSQWLYPVTLNGTLNDGVYTATITVDQISPVSYAFN